MNFPLRNFRAFIIVGAILTLPIAAAAYLYVQVNYGPHSERMVYCNELLGDDWQNYLVVEECRISRVYPGPPPGFRPSSLRSFKYIVALWNYVHIRDYFPPCDGRTAYSFRVLDRKLLEKRLMSESFASAQAGACDLFASSDLRHLGWEEGADLQFEAHGRQVRNSRVDVYSWIQRDKDGGLRFFLQSSLAADWDGICWLN